MSDAAKIDANHTGESDCAAPDELRGVKNLSELLKGAGLDTDFTEDFLTSLPLKVKKRVQALKKLQLEGIQVEAEFFKKIHEIECEFAHKFSKLHTKRSEIVSGKYEPTEDECDCALIHGLPEADLKKIMDGPAEEEGSQPSTEAEAVGVPRFWLHALKNVELLAEMIQDHDEPILAHLTDIELKLNKDPAGFTLVFHFSSNEWFSNASLTKEYKLKCDPDVNDPFEYDGPEIVACTGCKIEWKEGKNMTVKLIKKKQKHKGTGGTRFVTKQVKADSFFNFFDPPENSPDKETNMDEDTRLLLHSDFEIGQSLRDQVIPRAVLHFTGETAEDDEFDEDECDDEQDGMEDDEDDSDGDE